LENSDTSAGLAPTEGPGASKNSENIVTEEGSAP
jgi:hypothetical protein